MKRLTDSQKKESLQKILISLKFPKQYFIFSVNNGTNMLFSIASNTDLGGINIHSDFMSYDKIDCYLMGYYHGTINKFNLDL